MLDFTLPLCSTRGGNKRKYTYICVHLKRIDESYLTSTAEQAEKLIIFVVRQQRAGPVRFAGRGRVPVNRILSTRRLFHACFSWLFRAFARVRNASGMFRSPPGCKYHPAAAAHPLFGGSLSSPLIRADPRAHVAIFCCCCFVTIVTTIWSKIYINIHINTTN